MGNLMELRPMVELILIVISAALLVEFALWLWAYRQPGFKSLKAQIGKQGKKLEQLKSASQHSLKRNKKVDRLELHLKEQVTRQLATMRFKQTILTGASLFLLFRQLSHRYSGVTMAKLPFEPPVLLRKLTHRGLENPALNDCGFVFLYAILNVGVRPNIGKLLDLGPSRRMLSMAGLTISPGGN